MYCFLDDIKKIESNKKYFIDNLRDSNIDSEVCDAMSNAMNEVIRKLTSLEDREVYEELEITDEGCVYDEKKESYIVKDIDGLTRIIPRKNLVKDPHDLSTLGTNQIALKFLIDKVKGIGELQGRNLLIEYDSKRSLTGL